MKPLPCFLVLALGILSPIAQGQNMLRASLPDAPQPASKMDRVLRYAAWPGYGIIDHDRSRLGKAEKLTLAAERAAFAFDFATTSYGLSTSAANSEGNPMNTVFGSQSRAGVLGSMMSWELGYSYASAVVPHWFESTRYRNPVRIAVLLAGGYLAEERIRTGVCNIRVMSASQPAATQSCGQ